MNLSARGKRLLSLLQHGSICSQELLLPQYHADFGNYPPRAASELERWLALHAGGGRLVKSRDCIAHKNCIRYRLIPAVPLGKPLRAIPVIESERE